MNKIQRLMLYVHNDPDGLLDEHVLYQVSAFKEFGFHVLFISTSLLKPNDYAKITPLCLEVQQRTGTCSEFSALKETISSLDPAFLEEYDELILMDDAAYGPIFPLSRIFNRMDKKNVDFWNIVGISVKNRLWFFFSTFVAVRKKLFLSETFKMFWGQVYPEQESSGSGFFFAGAMTDYFAKAGYTCGAYIDLQDLDAVPEIAPELPLANGLTVWLLRSRALPFINIDAFSKKPGMGIPLGGEILPALTESGSTYPTTLVTEHLRRTRPVSWQSDLPGTLEVLDRDGPVLPDPGLKIAVFAHLFYPDQFQEALTRLKNIPYPFHLFVSMDTEEKRSYFLELMGKMEDFKATKTEVRLFRDRGRDVAPWLTGFRDTQNAYDLAFKFHMKKRAGVTPILVAQWQDFLMDCNLPSRAYVSRIIHLFKEDSRLGVAFHIEPFVQSALQGLTPHDWAPMKNIYEKLAVPNLKAETYKYIHPNNIFWYRPVALERLLFGDLHVEDFPEEPFPLDGTIAHAIERLPAYIAQTAGYSYKLFVPADLLEEYYANFSDRLQAQGYRARHLPVNYNYIPEYSVQCFSVKSSARMLGKSLKILLSNLLRFRSSASR